MAKCHRGSRLALFGDTPLMMRYKGDKTQKAIEMYVEVAKKFEIDPTQLAIQFCNIQPFVTSNIIGATTMEQLKICIDSIHLDINKEIMNEIRKVHKEIPNPAP